MRRLLLVSSSRTAGTGFLEHCRPAIHDHFGDLREVLFIPFALADHEGYLQVAATGFEPLGIRLSSIHHSRDPQQEVTKSKGIFVGGGNSFRLLKTLYELDLLEPIRKQVLQQSTPYMGSSAGTNLACPTIRTTNDMPIVEPPSLSALGLIPFQINPHYLDPAPLSTHQGETREQRIGEYLEENKMPVLGLREGSWLRIVGDECCLQGEKPARLFQRHHSPQELLPGDNLSFLLATASLSHMP